MTATRGDFLAGTLASIIARLDRLEHRRPRQHGALVPNYLTVDRNGNAGANFSGHVHAAGLDLDAPVASVGPDVDRVRWIRQSDGAVAAFISGVAPAGTEELVMGARALAPTDASLTAITAYDDQDNEQASVRVQQQSRGGGQVILQTSPSDFFVALDVGGGTHKSEFLQEGTGVAVWSLVGTGTLTWPGGALGSNFFTVNLSGPTTRVLGVATCDWTSTGQPVIVRAVSGPTAIVFIGFPYNAVAPAAGTTAQINYIVWGT